jgi:CHASE2 domain-containing sensor protein
MSVRSQGTTLFSAILILVATTVVLQLWLLTFSMEALLRGHFSTLVPAAIASTALFAVNAGLLRYVFRFDREAQRELDM